VKVLIACEYSGTVRDAFIAAGHDAMSCDLLPSDAPGPHYLGDVRDVLGDGWDLMIAHPPCTYLAVSGMHRTARGLRDPQLTEDALDFVRLLLAAPVPRIAVENPVSVISTRIRRPDQIVQPWQFGHDASKTTCLWLKGCQHCGPRRSSSPASSTVANAGATRPTPGRIVCHPAPTDGSAAARLSPASLRQWPLSGVTHDRRPDRNSDCPAAGAAAGPIMRAPARVAGRLSPRASPFCPRLSPLPGAFFQPTSGDPPMELRSRPDSWSCRSPAID
jgi:hypothetical protein